MVVWSCFVGNSHFRYFHFDFLISLIPFFAGCFPYLCMASKDLLLHLRSGKRLECPENVSKVLRVQSADALT